jgi:tRNA1Val (adenine37-N6)-methyltransferase
MKVNTLGCILGAYAACERPSSILDVGTGTGLIALMLAQRYPSASIEALEIDGDAALQAIENVRCSPWPHRIVVYHADVRSYTAADSFDLIVSNPPFFEKHRPTSDYRVNLARHDAGLTAEQLLQAVLLLLSEDGVFFLVLPEAPMQWFSALALQANLFSFRKLVVRNFRDSKPLAVVQGLSRIRMPMVEEELIIWDAPGVPAEQFKQLLSEYYLDF